MTAYEETLEQLKEYRKNSLIGFEFEFHIAFAGAYFDTLIKNLQFGKHYWMYPVSMSKNDMIRLRGIELDSGDVLFLDLEWNGKNGFICVPNDGDIEIVTRFADRLNANIYGDDVLFYKGGFKNTKDECGEIKPLNEVIE